MQLVITAIAVTMGMAFSLGIAILTEEVIFGKVLAPLFEHSAKQVKSQPVLRHN